jgi:paraquat-inducible protein B
MSKKASKTLIGAFVLGAVALMFTGVMIFGSGKFFTERKKFVMYFKGSVKGLNVGAPVMFRGVKIGSVSEIQLIFNPDDFSVNIPVIVEIEPERFMATGAIGKEKNVIKAKKYPYIQPLIEKGLKAQLQMQSILTGQLLINLDFYPAKPARVSGYKSKYPEIPTIKSSIEEITATIEELPLQELLNRAISSLGGIEQLVRNPELFESIRSIKIALKDIQELIQNVNSQVAPLVKSIESTSETARSAFKQAEQTLAMKEGVSGQLVSKIQGTLQRADNTLQQAEQTLSGIQSTIEDRRILYELNQTLKEVSAAARSIRFLTDYLEQHPEALLRGKEKAKGEGDEK